MVVVFSAAGQETLESAMGTGLIEDALHRYAKRQGDGRWPRNY